MRSVRIVGSPVGRYERTVAFRIDGPETCDNGATLLLIGRGVRSQYNRLLLRVILCRTALQVADHANNLVEI